MGKAAVKPHVRDAEATKTSILDAAEEEFAKDGLAGARVDAISAKTGVTKAMIYYYYKSKEQLYKAVLERAFTKRVSETEGMDIGGSSAEDALVSWLSSVLDACARNKNMSSIMVYEAVQNRGKYYKQLSISSLYKPLCDILERGMNSGQFREIDPLHAAVNLVGMCAFYFCVHENVKHLWPPGTDPLSPEMSRAHAAEVIDMAVAAVRKQS
jgi:AcrR family transcriptional regulator